MKRTIGLGGAVVIIVGFVIGIAIFILPGELAASTGPAVVISYALASLMALFSCVVAAQIGSVFPVTGGSFVAVSRLISPFWGFIIVWLMIGGSAIVIGLLSFGFADYLQLIWPGLNRRLVAFLLVCTIGALNLLGVKDALIGQGIMVISLLFALSVFSFAGFVHLEVDNLTPFMPNGFSPVLAATVPAFFSYAGFMVVIELGGEIKHPSRNIPLALAISFTTVLLVYSLVSVATVGVIPWQELGEIKAPLGEAARRILPAWVAMGITLTALAAAASSVNVMLLGYSRDLVALARARVLPALIEKISGKGQQPVNSILLLVSLALVTVIIGGKISELATLIVIAMLVFQIVLGIAALLVPRKMAKQYVNSGLSMGTITYRFFCIGLIVLSLALLVTASFGNPGTVMIGGFFILAGVVYYLIRRSSLARKGIHIEDRIQTEIDAITAE